MQAVERINHQADGEMDALYVVVENCARELEQGDVRSAQIYARRALQQRSELLLTLLQLKTDLERVLVLDQPDDNNNNSGAAAVTQQLVAVCPVFLDTPQPGLALAAQGGAA